MTSNAPEHSLTDSATPTPPPSPAVAVRRIAGRAKYDAESIHAVIDAALVAHVGTVRDGLPLVIPMFCVRDNDHLLLHGAPAAGVLRRGEGVAVCATMTLLDGLVLARSPMHHSMNYRSAVVIGTAELVDDPADKRRCLDLFVERLVPDSLTYLRATNTKETRGTTVLRLSLDQASVKVRTGGPIDDDEDYELPIWAGVLPIRSTIGEPVADERNLDGLTVPDAVAALVGRTL